MHQPYENNEPVGQQVCCQSLFMVGPDGQNRQDCHNRVNYCQLEHSCFSGQRICPHFAISIALGNKGASYDKPENHACGHVVCQECHCHVLRIITVDTGKATDEILLQLLVEVFLSGVVHKTDSKVAVERVLASSDLIYVHFADSFDPD